MVRKRARRGFKPGGGSQCPAVGSPLLVGRQLCVHKGLPRYPRRQVGKTSWLRGRDPRGSAPPRAARRARSRSALYLFADNRRAGRQYARSPHLRHRRSHRPRIGLESGTLSDAIVMTFDIGRLIEQITHLVRAGTICWVLSNAVTLTPPFWTCGGWTPTAPHIPRPKLRIRLLLPNRRQPRLYRPHNEKDLLIAVNQALSDCKPQGRLSASRKLRALLICRRIRQAM